MTKAKNRQEKPEPDQETLERAARLVEAIMDENTSRDIRVRMNEWFRSRASMNEKMRAMEDYMHEVLVPASKPDKLTIRMFRAFKRKYGIETPVRITWKRVAMRVAAVLLPPLFVAGGFLLSHRLSSDSDPVSRVVITAEASKEVTLPDGSGVRMKSGTTLEYYEAGFTENRKLALDGEAFFTVTPDAVHPFIVESGDVAVTVLGTEFNMRASGSEPHAEVVLVSGSVEVSSGENIIVLKPSQKATIDRKNHTIELDEISGAELSRIRGHELILDDISLEEALRRTGEYFGVTMHIEADVPAVDGMIVRLDDEPTLDRALLMIRLINPVFDYRIEEDTVTITKRK